MARCYQTFESGQSAGTSVTAANSAVGGTPFASVTVGLGGALTYVSGTGARGALCVRYNTGLLAAVPAYATWTGLSLAGRVYGRCTLTPAFVPNTASVVRARNGGNQLFRITSDFGGGLVLRNAANTAVATSAGNQANGVPWRIAWDIGLGAAASGTVYIYTDITSSVPAETLTVTGVNFGTGPCTEVDVGLVTNTGNVDVRLDDFLVCDEGLPGAPSTTRSVSEAVVGGDAVGRQVIRARGLAETAVVGDGVARGALTLPRAVSEAVSVLDGPGRAGLTRARAVAELVGIGDVLTRTSPVRARAVAENIAVGDTAGRGGLSGVRSLADELGLADTPAGVSSRMRMGGEAVTVSDQPSGVGVGQRAVAEALAIGDAVVRVAAAGRALGEVLAVADAAGRVVSQGRTSTEAIVVGDAVSRQALLGSAALVDAVALEDTPARIMGQARALDDGLVVVDAPGRGAAAGARAVAETLAFTDAVSRGQAGQRAAGEAVQVADQVTRAARLGTVTVTESLELADALTRTGAGISSVMEAVDLDDRAGRSPAGSVRVVSDGVSLTELASRTANTGRAVTDGVTVLNAVGRAMPLVRDVVEAVTVGGMASYEGLVQARMVYAPVTVADLAAGLLSGARAVDETVTVTAGAGRRSVLARVVVERVTAADRASAPTRLRAVYGRVIVRSRTRDFRTYSAGLVRTNMTGIDMGGS